MLEVWQGFECGYVGWSRVNLFSYQQLCDTDFQQLYICLIEAMEFHIFCNLETFIKLWWVSFCGVEHVFYKT